MVCDPCKLLIYLLYYLFELVYGKHNLLIIHFALFCLMFLLLFLQAGEKFCSMDEINGEIWPKCPDGNTVINRTCPVGRVGFKSRTCIQSTWQPVYSKCISQELSKVMNSAEVSVHYSMVLCDFFSPYFLL